MPSWALVLLTVAYLLVLAVHVRHLLEVRGQARAWHVAHVVMALGMVNMTVPSSWTGADGMPVPAAVATPVFAAATVVAAALALRAGLRRRRATALWAMVAVGAAGMTWMYDGVGHGDWSAVVTVLFAAWFVLETALWTTGALTARVHALEVRDLPQPAPAAGTAGEGDLLTAQRVEAAVAVGHEHSRAARATLAVMAVGTAWMLLAMQFGTHVAGTTGMDGSGHHH